MYLNRRRILSVLSVAAVLPLIPFTAAVAERRGTREEAQAMVEQAIELFRTDGVEATIAAINMPHTRFMKADLYVFVIAPEGRTVAHGFDHSRIGLDVAMLSDPSGKPYGRELLAATAEGIWVDYTWRDPMTETMEPKSTWAKKVDGYIFACGVYTPA